MISDKAQRGTLRTWKREDEETCYLVYEDSSSGAQLWGCISGSWFGPLRPHFNGKSRNNICLLQVSSEYKNDDVDIAFDGSYTAAWGHDSEGIFDFLADASNYILADGEKRVEVLRVAEVSDKDAKEIKWGTCGFIATKADGKRKMYRRFEFTCPNYACTSKDPKYMEFPCNIVVQLTAFAESELDTFYSVEEYHDSEKYRCGDEYNNLYAGQCFCSGDFLDDLSNFKGVEFAIIVGTVVEVEEKKNELTGENFYWVLLRTVDDIEIDVVIGDKSLFESCEVGVPKVGGVLYGHFWLSGFLMGEAVHDDDDDDDDDTEYSRSDDVSYNSDDDMEEDEYDGMDTDEKEQPCDLLEEQSHSSDEETEAEDDGEQPDLMINNELFWKGTYLSTMMKNLKTMTIIDDSR